MRFKAYVLRVEKKGKYLKLNNIDGDALRHGLNTYKKITEEDGIYCPMYIKKKDNLILGTLVQSYIPDLKTFKNNESNEEISIAEETVNDRTLYYIDLDDEIVYIQNKRYPSDKLKHMKTLERIQKILSECMGEEKLTFLPVEINYTMSEISAIFKESNVKEIHFKNLTGISVPDDAEIHNPIRAWDDTVAKSWNRYSKDDLYSVDLKAAEGKSLTKNPIARLCMILASQGNDEGKEVFSKMTVISNGNKEDIKLKGNQYKVINISKKKQENSMEAYDSIIKKKYPDYDGRLEE